jgi:hypothetical protein
MYLLQLDEYMSIWHVILITAFAMRNSHVCNTLRRDNYLLRRIAGFLAMLCFLTAAALKLVYTLHGP